MTALPSYKNKLLIFAILLSLSIAHAQETVHLQCYNLIKKTIVLTATIIDGETGHERTNRLTISPGQTKSIALAAGLAFKRATISTPLLASRLPDMPPAKTTIDYVQPDPAPDKQIVIDDLEVMLYGTYIRYTVYSNADVHVSPWGR